MKVICIKDKHSRVWTATALTIGKVYESPLSITDGFIWIYNDNGDGAWYPIRLFISLEEYRNKKLESIGI